MRFNAKVVVVLTTIVGVEWVRAAPPVTRCKEKCAGHHVIGVKISQTDNTFQGVNVVGAEINQTENNFSSSGDGGNVEAAVIDCCGGALIECGSSDCNSEIVDGVNETSKKDGQENGDSLNTSSGSSAPTNDKKPAGKNQNDNGNEKSTNVPSGDPAPAAIDKDNGCNNKKTSDNGDSAPTNNNDKTDKNKDRCGNEKSTNVASGDPATVTDEDKPDEIEKGRGNENTTSSSSDGLNTGGDGTTKRNFT